MSTTRSTTTNIGRPTSRRKSRFREPAEVGAPPLALLCAMYIGSGFSRTVQAPDTITGIRVHGNVATSDDEIRRLAGIEVGAAVGPDTVAAVAARLRATKRFDRVEVLKRYASISDPTQILLVIIVDEGVVDIKVTGDAD